MKNNPKEIDLLQDVNMRRSILVTFVFLLLNLPIFLLPSLACPHCSTPSPPPPPPPTTTPCPPPPPPKKPRSPPPPTYTAPNPPPPTYTAPNPPPPKKSPPPPTYTTPTPPPPKTTTPSSPPPPAYTAPSPPPPTSKVPCPPPPKAQGTCPIDTLKLDACVDLLGGLVHVVIGGGDVTQQCCPVLEGLADLDAALCLCTTIRAKALGIKLLLPVALEVLVDCGKHVPSDYQCPEKIMLRAILQGSYLLSSLRNHQLYVGLDQANYALQNLIPAASEWRVGTRECAGVGDRRR
ncbi:hypothetical protein Cni_G03442 [Canna indica]|uniref:Hydrophobic seed protein domain-containing protein n=1 Tax=Canna indica TaxID=4628 RepID=A0AAQ3JRL5_9LILI|nr:hypothetical protein Cni_G03442 [Canna indica]